jgi:hypothetical protein
MSLLLLLANRDDGTVTPPTGEDLDVLYRPVLNDVARRIRARLYVGGGRGPEFLDDTDENGPTDPTKTEVLALIDDAAADVASRVGVNLPESLHPIARRVVALGTVLIIEVGSSAFDTERYDRLKTEYDEKLARLLDNAQDLRTGGEAGDQDDRVLAVGTFPAASHRWDWPEGSEVPRDPRRWWP